MTLSLNSIIKYVLEGLAVAVATYLIAGKLTSYRDIALLSLTAGLTFMILDLFATEVGAGARQGTGFGLGAKVVGFPNGALPFLGEGFEGEGFYNQTQEGFQTDLNAVNMPNNAPEMTVITTQMELPSQHAVTMMPGNLDQTVMIPPPEEPAMVIQPESFKGDDKNCQTEIPYRFPNPNYQECKQTAVGHSASASYIGPTKTKSRWMKWIENGKPINANTNEYKIVPGLYAKYNIQPGYNEGIRAANHVCTDELAPTIWPTTNPIDKSYFRLRENFIRDDTEMLPSETPFGDPVLIEPRQNNTEGFESSQTVRLNGVVYSGDIINILAGTNTLQRGLVNSQVIFDRPLPNIKTNLSKLRLVLAEGRHDPRKQVALKYGDPIYIKHNALINNNNETRYIKYGERLQSHQEGPLFRIFKIFNKKDMKSQDYVKYGDEIVLAKGDQADGDRIYLHIESDKSVSSEATLNNASSFALSLERVYELYDRALCVCPKETLFP